MGQRYLEIIPLGKALVVSVAAICVAAVLYAVYLLLFSG
jgi:hypothetical protein